MFFVTDHVETVVHLLVIACFMIFVITNRSKYPLEQYTVTLGFHCLRLIFPLSLFVLFQNHNEGTVTAMVKYHYGQSNHSDVTLESAYLVENSKIQLVYQLGTARGYHNS